MLLSPILTSSVYWITYGQSHISFLLSPVDVIVIAMEGNHKMGKGPKGRAVQGRIKKSVWIRKDSVKGYGVRIK